MCSEVWLVHHRVPTWVGKTASWLWNQPLKTLIFLLRHAALVWTSLQDGVKWRTKRSVFWYGAPLRNKEGRAAPRHKGTVFGEAVNTQKQLCLKVSLSSAAGPPTPIPIGVTAPAGVWCHNHCAGQAAGTAAGLGATHPFLMRTCRSYPVSMCPGSCRRKAFWESLGWVGFFFFLVLVLVNLTQTESPGNREPQLRDCL